MRAQRPGLRLLPAVCLALTLVGCNRNRGPSTESQENPIKPNLSGGAAQGAVRAGAQRQVNQNLMQSIGQYYNLYRTENGRPPRNVAEFTEYVQSDPNARNVAQALQKEWLVMVFPNNPGSNSIIGYEKEEVQIQHNHLVVFADGHILRMTTAELDQALRNQQ
jgi:hypothetical protein